MQIELIAEMMGAPNEAESSLNGTQWRDSSRPPFFAIYEQEDDAA